MNPSNIKEWMGVIGCIIAIANTFVIWSDRRQKVKVVRLPPTDQLNFRLVNRSLRAIPLESLTIFFREKKGRWIRTWTRGTELKVKDFTLPGELRPEESREVDFEIGNFISTMVYDAFRIELKTQKGTRISRFYRRLPTTS